MMWTDKAFAIWMGHAGEDSRFDAQDDAGFDARTVERTHVRTIARRDVMAAEAPARTRGPVRDCEPEGIAA